MDGKFNILKANDYPFLAAKQKWDWNTQQKKGKYQG